MIAKEVQMTTGIVRGDYSFLVLAGAIALVLGFLAPSAGAEQPSLLANQATASSAAGLSNALSGEQIVECVSPSVVLILVGRGGEQATAVGSGVIVWPHATPAVPVMDVSNLGSARLLMS